MKPWKNKLHLKKIIPYSWNSIFKEDEDSPKLKVEMLIEPKKSTSQLDLLANVDSDESDLEDDSNNNLKEEDSISLYDEICSELAGKTLERTQNLPRTKLKRKYIEKPGTKQGTEKPKSRLSLPEPALLLSELSKDSSLLDVKRKLSDGLLFCQGDDAGLRYGWRGVFPLYCSVVLHP